MCVYRNLKCVDVGVCTVTQPEFWLLIFRGSRIPITYKAIYPTICIILPWMCNFFFRNSLRDTKSTDIPRSLSNYLKINGNWKQFRISLNWRGGFYSTKRNKILYHNLTEYLRGIPRPNEKNPLISHECYNRQPSFVRYAVTVILYCWT